MMLNIFPCVYLPSLFLCSEMCVQIFAHFKIGLFFCYQVLRVFFLIYSSYKSSIRYMFYKHFLPVCNSSFHFLNSIFFKKRKKLFNFEKFNLSAFSVMSLLCFCVLYKKSLPKDKSQRFSPIFSSVILFRRDFFSLCFCFCFFYSFMFYI